MKLIGVEVIDLWLSFADIKKNFSALESLELIWSRIKRNFDDKNKVGWGGKFDGESEFLDLEAPQGAARIIFEQIRSLKRSKWKLY